MKGVQQGSRDKQRGISDVNINILRPWCVQTDCRCGGGQLRLVWDILPSANLRRGANPHRLHDGERFKVTSNNPQKWVFASEAWAKVFICQPVSFCVRGARLYCCWLKAGHHEGQRWNHSSDRRWCSEIKTRKGEKKSRIIKQKAGYDTRENASCKKRKKEMWSKWGQMEENEQGVLHVK